MTSSKEYKKLIEGFLGGLLLAAGGNSRARDMLPKSQMSHDWNTSFSNQGLSSGNSTNGKTYFWNLGDKNAQTDFANEQNGFSATSNGNSTVSSMVNSNGGNSPTTKDSKWIFIANPNCCDKCLAMNGKIEIGTQEPLYYGHVPNRDGRFNCRCHWIRIS